MARQRPPFRPRQVIQLLCDVDQVDLRRGAAPYLVDLLGEPTRIVDLIGVRGLLDHRPTVEEIGLRATKIRTFADAVESIPNGTLANNEMTNWSRMDKRRIKMTIGLEYRTSRAQIEKILERIRGYITGNDDIDQGATQLIHMVEFNDSSIDILLYYFTKTTNWGEWMQIREQNMLEFMRIVEEEGAAFAFPTRSIYMENVERPPA